MAASEGNDVDMTVYPDERLDNYDSDEFELSSTDDSDNDTFDQRSGDAPLNREASPPPPEDNEEILDLTATLDTLCTQATAQLALLPRQTRNKLSSQTRSIFQRYEQHGSEQRLRLNLEQYLLAPDDDDLDYTPAHLTLSPSPKSHAPSTPTPPTWCSASPFHAADLALEISGDVALPPYLLPSLDRIFGLYALEARALLKHHCAKYGNEPIFRAGISEYMQTQLHNILGATQDDDLALSPETRAFFRSVFERQPEVNVAEKRMLARATRVGVETVEMFWEDLAVRWRAYFGMRAFVAAREVEIIRKEEKERCVTYNEKQYISNGISQLSNKQMGEALKLIQHNVPHLKGGEETELELDIDRLPDRVLLKLLHLIEKSSGGPLPLFPAGEERRVEDGGSGNQIGARTRSVLGIREGSGI